MLSRTYKRTYLKLSIAMESPVQLGAVSLAESLSVNVETVGFILSRSNYVRLGRRVLAADDGVGWRGVAIGHFGELRVQSPRRVRGRLCGQADANGRRLGRPLCVGRCRAGRLSRYSE